MQLLIFLVLGYLSLCRIDGAAVVKDIDHSENDVQEFDPDDDTDPFEDEDEPIHYPVKSVMPKAVINDQETHIISAEENGSGSGAGTIKVDQSVKLAGRLASLEQYLLILATKLNKQEQVNNDLLSAIRSQQLQQMQERDAFGNTIGSLQATISQLSGRVSQIPLEINRERRKRRQQYLASAISMMSEKLNQLGEHMNKAPSRRGTGIVTRSKESDVSLLGKLLGKDVAKALSAPSTTVSKAGTKDLTAVFDPHLTTTAAVATHPLIPIDMQPQSHFTSLSTPTGQGPAGSASSTPIQPGLSYMQLPSQTNIAAPSTPTGSGPVGSITTIDPGLNAIADQHNALSITTVPSDVKQPVTAGGYNILPMVPLQQIQASHVPLEPPGTITPHIAPEAAVVENAAAPVPVVPSTPGVVSPYEVLTSSQMLPYPASPVPNGNALFNRRAAQDGNPYEVLTSSQMRNPRFSSERLTKHIKIAKVIDKNKEDHVQAKRKLKLQNSSKSSKPKEEKFHSHSKSGKKNINDIELGPAQKDNNKSRSLNAAKANDSLINDLERAIKIGTFRRVEHHENTSSRRAGIVSKKPEKYPTGMPENIKLKGIIVRSEKRG